LTTYASKPIKVYLIKSYITQTMFCIASSRPSLIPPIITALYHAHMTDHSLTTDTFNRLQFYYPYAILSSLLIVFNVCMFSLSCNCVLTVVKYTDMLCVIKSWTGLSVEESIRMTEDRDKWRKYVHGVAKPRIEDG